VAGICECGNETSCSIKCGEFLEWQSRGIYRVLVGKHEGKRLLGRHRRRWEDNIKMDLQEVVYDGMDWIDLAQERVSCECGNEPSCSIKCG